MLAIPIPSNNFVPISEKGAANGVATLDGSTLIPLTQIPAVLTGKDADTLDGNHASAFSLTGHNHDSTYAPLSHVNVADAHLPSQTDNNGKFLTTDGSVTSWATVLSGVTDHSLLSNLAYALSGHTGFEPAVTKGNLTAGSSKVSIGGIGTGALIGAGASVDITEANITHNNIGGLTTGDPHIQYQKETDFTAGSILFRGASAITEDNANLFWDDTNNGLCIGITSLATNAKATIEGNLTVRKGGASGSASALDAGLFLAKDTANTATGMRGVYAYSQYKNSSAVSGGQIAGLNASGEWSGTANYTASTGVVGGIYSAYAYPENTGLTLSNLKGIGITVLSNAGLNGGALTISNGMQGVTVSVVTDSLTTVANIHGLLVAAPNLSGVITNYYGLEIREASAGTPTNMYGIYLNELIAGGTINNEIFIAGGGEIFFRGQTIRVGSLTIGHLDLTADISIDMNGAVIGTSTALFTRFIVDDIGTYIDKDGSNNMIFVDAVTGSKTLAELAAGGGGGEANTASSSGSGISLYYQKSGVDLQFNAIKSESNKLTVALDAVTHDVELTINEGNITHGGLSGTHNLTTDINHNALTNYVAGEHFLQTAITNVSTGLATGLLKVTTGTGALSSITDSSANWDAAYTHISNTSNPHSVTKAQVGLSNAEDTALSTWAGSANLTTLGTIGTGVWNATAIGVGKGGTGATTFTDGGVLIGNGTGTVQVTSAGTAGQVLTSNGVGVDPTFQAKGFEYTLQTSSARGSPADATTYYTGSMPVLIAQTVSGVQRVYIPKTGTIKIIYVTFYNSGTLGSTETSTIYLRLNDTTDTVITSSVVNDTVITSYSNTNLSISVVAGDYIELKWVSPTWTTNPTLVSVYSTIYIE